MTDELSCIIFGICLITSALVINLQLPWQDTPLSQSLWLLSLVIRGLFYLRRVIRPREL